MKAKFHSVALLAAALAALSTAGFAVDKKVNAYDESFIKDAGAGGKAEVKISELAVKKTDNADVKAFAQMMVTDHTAVNTELAALADKKGVDLSAVIEPKSATKFQKLEKSSGKDFDNAYLKDMQADHKRTISMFESAQKKAEDSDLKAFVGKTLPGLKEHLSKVEKLLGK